MNYPVYYAELSSNINGTENKHFACDTMAINYFASKYDDLMAVIKDDGNGNISVVQEFSN